MNDEEDERIKAWDTIARHPIFRPAYEKDCSLLAAMVGQLDALHDSGCATADKFGEVQERVGVRIARAFHNGYSAGLMRGQQGRFDE